MSRDLEATEQSELERQPHGPSQLFLLRVWEGDRPGPTDWQGVLQQTVTGETRYFRSCEELRRILFEFASPRSGSGTNAL